MERTIGKGVHDAINGKRGEPSEDQPAPSPAAALPDVCCAKCRYYVERFQFMVQARVCTAMPPQPVAIPQQTERGVHMNIVCLLPAVDANSFCRMFERRADG